MVMIMAWLPIVMCNICIMQHFVPYLRSKSSEVSINSQYLFLMHLKDEKSWNYSLKKPIQNKELYVWFEHHNF